MRLPPPGHLGARHRLLLAAEILAAYVPLLRALRREDIPTLAGRARAPGRAPQPVAASSQQATAIRLGSIVAQVLAPLPTDNRCLIQSVVLLRVLARRSIAAELLIGVELRPSFTAHAWLERDGQALLPALGFEPTTRL